MSLEILKSPGINLILAESCYIGSEQTATSSGSKGDVVVMSTCSASSLHGNGIWMIVHPLKNNPYPLVLCLLRFFHTLLQRTGLEPSNRLKRKQLTLFCSSSAARVNSCDGRQRWLSSTSLAGVLFRLRDRGFVCKASRCMAQRKRGLTRGVHLDHENQSKGLWDVSPVSSRLVMFPMNLQWRADEEGSCGTSK